MRLALEDVWKAYDGHTALAGVSVAIGPGERWALLGPSGAGKTTLLRIADLLDLPDGGAVTADGSPPTDLLRARRRMAMVMQKPVVFCGSVLDNAAYGLRARGVVRGAAEERARAALAAVGLHGKERRMARRLSGGEQQRLAFARSLVVEPEILLLDEFTANLDPGNSRILETALSDFASREGKAVVFATHDVFQARRLATHAAVLLGGKLVAAGGRGVLDSPVDARARAFVSGELVS